MVRALPQLRGAVQETSTSASLRYTDFSKINKLVVRSKFVNLSRDSCQTPSRSSGEQYARTCPAGARGRGGRHMADYEGFDLPKLWGVS